MSKLINILLAIVVLAAAGMLLYPTVSDQYNQYQNYRRIYNYNRTAEHNDPEVNLAMLEAARAYNASLGEHRTYRDAFTQAAEGSEAYNALLNPSEDGIMGVIEIPKIGLRLPIYHGTGDYVLQRGVGHMEGTSLPVGGAGTHCGLSGHRGLPSARLFTDLDRLIHGDVFYINVLGQLLAYRVDQISVVLPDELEYMDPVEDHDYVTLVTCTPYGVNTHRLLVRGERAPLEDIEALTAGQESVESLPAWRAVLICGIPAMALGLLMMLLIHPRKRFGLRR